MIVANHFFGQLLVCFTPFESADLRIHGGFSVAG